MKNRNVVYSGKVGAKMRPSRPRREPVKRKSFHCTAGPFANKWIRLELNGDGRTLPLCFGGWCGHYELQTPGNALTWVPVQ